MTTTHTQPAGCDLDSLAQRLRAQCSAPFGPEGFSLLCEAADVMRNLARAAQAPTGLQDEQGLADEGLDYLLQYIPVPAARVAAQCKVAELRAAQAPQGDTRQGAPADQVKHGDMPSIEITLRQAKELVDCFGGYDAEISIIQRPAAWSDMPDGLYAYFSEYPDEGSMYLGPTEVDDDLATNGEPDETPAAHTCTGCDPAEGFCRACREAERNAAPEAPATEQQGLLGYVTPGALGQIADMGTEFSTFRNIMVRNKPGRDAVEPIYSRVPAATTASGVRTVACSDSTVYVCAERDIECGDRSANWCATCPKRRAADGQQGASRATTREAAYNRAKFSRSVIQENFYAGWEAALTQQGASRAALSDWLNQAADMLQTYHAYLMQLSPINFDEHPYLPAIEETAEELRTLARAPLPAQGAAQVEAARDAVLEEAANVCKPGLIDAATAYEIAAIRKCAEAIRVLKSDRAAQSRAQSDTTGESNG